MHRGSIRAIAAVTLLLISSFLPPSLGVGRAQQGDPRLFAETGYRVSQDEFWDFFQRRGGLKTFGYPVSREFTLQGFTVQFFQRTIMQLGPSGVRTLNLLDQGLLPYTTINGSTFPPADPAVIAATPTPTGADYASRVVEFTRQTAPDSWEGLPVNFFKTFSETVSYEQAFPAAEGPRSLLPLINLEIWGAPTSQPTRDPNNRNFVYQRFQRGVMHYDDACKCTQGLLLADYLKAVMTGENLPSDLEAQAADSPFYKQYKPDAANGLARPALLADSNLKDGFAKGATSQASAAAPPATRAEPKPDSSARAQRSNQPYRAASPEYGMNVFLWGNQGTTDRDLKRVGEAGFGWQKTLFQWRLIEPAKGVFDWSEADRIVAASKQANVKIIARLDFQPDWARGGAAVHNGPPDNYQDFSDFVYAFVARYSADSQIGRVHAVQIWNEQNLDREWGMGVISKQSAADYVRLLKGAYEAAKGADPSIVVISGGLSPTATTNGQAQPDDTYLRWMYEAGAKAYFDVLGAHGPGFKAPPTASPEEVAANKLYGGYRVFAFRRVEDLRKVMVDNGDSDKQVWLLEFGWTSDSVHPDYAWHSVSEEEKADYLVGAYQWAHKNWSPWIGVMTLWTMPDPNWSQDREEYWWAIVNPDGSSRPAYDRLLRARREGSLP